MRVIELFAGAGGLGMGVSRAGFRPVAVVERDRWCCDTIRENQARGLQVVSKWPLIEADVRDLDFSEHEGRVDLVTGGPPCQPFSLGGKHRAFDDERDMWPEAVRAVRETRPKAFVFENVKGLTRAAFATYLDYIVLQLTYPHMSRVPGENWSDHMARLQAYSSNGRKSSGETYNVGYKILNAADFGVPQRRERVIFVGFRSDLESDWSFPRPTHSLEALLWQQRFSGEYWERHAVAKRERVVDERSRRRGEQLSFPPESLPWRTVRDAISDLPDPERDVAAAATYLNHRFQAGARVYPGHTGSPLDEPAKTLKAGVHGVPGGENMLVRADGTVRYFTVRESARLQTFPDNFIFHGSWTETMRQLGNAVPVKLAYIVADSIKLSLMGSGVKDGQQERRKLGWDDYQPA